MNHEGGGPFEGSIPRSPRRLSSGLDPLFSGFGTHLRWLLVCGTLIGLSTATTAETSSPSPEPTQVRFMGHGVDGAATIELLADSARCPDVASRRLAVGVPGARAIDTSGCSWWKLHCLRRCFPATS